MTQAELRAKIRVLITSGVLPRVLPAAEDIVPGHGLRATRLRGRGGSGRPCLRIGFLSSTPPDTPSDAAVCLRSCAALSVDVEGVIDGIDALARRS